MRGPPHVVVLCVSRVSRDESRCVKGREEGSPGPSQPCRTVYLAVLSTVLREGIQAGKMSGSAPQLRQRKVKVWHARRCHKKTFQRQVQARGDFERERDYGRTIRSPPHSSRTCVAGRPATMFVPESAQVCIGGMPFDEYLVRRIVYQAGTVVERLLYNR